MDYIDGFVAAVPTANREKYRKHAELFANVFKENGATRYVETWGDDVPTGKTTSFPQAVKLEPGETVVFSWVAWPSRRVSRRSNEKSHGGPPHQECEMPFDGKRMIYGGFQTILDR